ncbi:hypothetical protein HMPREF1861_00231 [Corynebacterium kroppenstedtii]|nr:hypothetical protein HMPREF1861_00231 [Corynebacterium kroppenstedtii]
MRVTCLDGKGGASAESTTFTLNSSLFEYFCGCAAGMYRDFPGAQTPKAVSVHSFLCSDE